MIIHDCPNALCRTPIDTGECKKECIKRYEKEKGIKTTYAEIKEKTLEQIYEDIKRFKNLVEVVRCKDCRYFYRDDEFNRAWCGYDKCVANEVAVNGYCYRGERKDNERKAD